MKLFSFVIRESPETRFYEEELCPCRDPPIPKIRQRFVPGEPKQRQRRPEAERIGRSVLGSDRKKESQLPPPRSPSPAAEDTDTPRNRFKDAKEKFLLLEQERKSRPDHHHLHRNDSLAYQLATNRSVHSHFLSEYIFIHVHDSQILQRRLRAGVGGGEAAETGAQKFSAAIVRRGGALPQQRRCAATGALPEPEQPPSGEVRAEATLDVRPDRGGASEELERDRQRAEEALVYGPATTTATATAARV